MANPELAVMLHCVPPHAGTVVHLAAAQQVGFGGRLRQYAAVVKNARDAEKPEQRRKWGVARLPLKAEACLSSIGFAAGGNAAKSSFSLPIFCSKTDLQ
jgi:hypothetical protein